MFRNTHLVQIPFHILIKRYRKNTRLLALVIFYENGGKFIRKLFRVFSCVIYTITGRYVCIDYLGSEESKLSGLKIACTGSSKHNVMDYNKWHTNYTQVAFFWLSRVRNIWVSYCNSSVEVSAGSNQSLMNNTNSSSGCNYTVQWYIVCLV